MPITQEIKELLRQYGADEANITINLDLGLTILVYQHEESLPDQFPGDELARKIATLCLGSEAPITPPIKGMEGYALQDLPG